jgi:tRNA dimethylallyltransferase
MDLLEDSARPASIDRRRLCSRVSMGETTPGLKDDPREAARRGLEPVLALVGPTATGKSALALELAEQHGAEILSLDSMLVYRGMDVGTAKPSAAHRARVRHHLIDLVDPGASFSVQDWLAAAERALADCRARNVRALFVGGTHFYLAALLRGLFAGPPVDRALRAALEARARAEGSAALHAELARLDPTSAARLHANDQKRIVRALEVLTQTGRPLSAWQEQAGWRDGAGEHLREQVLVGVDLKREPHARLVRLRVEAMLEAGWVEEACAIRSGGGFSPTSIQALGYREVLALADGELTRTACIDAVAAATRKLARKQRTWLRRMRIECWLNASADRTSNVLAAARALGWIQGP